MSGSVAIVRAISAAKIPLIISSARVDKSVEDLVTTMVLSDPAYEGEVVGKLAAQLVPEGGKAAIIEGVAGTEGQIARTAGFRKGIAGSKIDIVQQQLADWDRAKAMSAADDLITSIPDLKIIYAQDDSMALGAVEAVKAAGKLNQIKVFGLGYMGDEVKTSLKVGELQGTCTQSPAYEGSTIVEKALAAINGEKLEKWYMTECLPVTKDTADTIDHGFN
jgi:ABC-type sugar transport system substrate-binding protein